MKNDNKINREELKMLLAAESGLSKVKVDAFLNAFTKIVEEALINGKTIHISGFGKFEVREHSAKKCANPRTGEIMEIPKAKVPAFRASATLRSAVNKEV